MSERNNKKQLNLFELMKDLNEQDKNLQDSGVPITEDNAKLMMSNQLVGARSHPGGGVIEMGITDKTLKKLMTPSPTGKNGGKICILCIIDQKAYEEYKKVHGFK